MMGVELLLGKVKSCLNAAEVRSEEVCGGTKLANTEEAIPALRFLARIESSWHWIPQRIVNPSTSQIYSAFASEEYGIFYTNQE